jgi:hypothetical protein
MNIIFFNSSFGPNHLDWPRPQRPVKVLRTLQGLAYLARV